MIFGLDLFLIAAYLITILIFTVADCEVRISPFDKMQWRVLWRSLLFLTVMVGLGVSGFIYNPDQIYLLILGVWFGFFFLKFIFGGTLAGGSDQMSAVIGHALCAICVAQLLSDSPEVHSTVKKIAIYYLTVQVFLSYFIAGLTKIRNPEWINGLALRKIIDFAPIVQPKLVGQFFGKNAKSFKVVSWCVIIAEIVFPFMIFVDGPVRVAFFCAALCFHFVIFFLMGLNRFVWVWGSAFSLLILGVN